MQLRPLAAALLLPTLGCGAEVSSSTASAASRCAEGTDALTRLHRVRERDEAVQEILASGNQTLRATAALRLVSVADSIVSDSWRDSHRSKLQEADARAGVPVTQEQLESQLIDYQAAVLLQLYSPMAAIGGEPVLRHALSVAGNSAHPRRIRAAALTLARDLASAGATGASAVVDQLARELEETPEGEGP